MFNLPTLTSQTRAAPASFRNTLRLLLLQKPQAKYTKRPEGDSSDNSGSRTPTSHQTAAASDVRFHPWSICLHRSSPQRIVGHILAEATYDRQINPDQAHSSREKHRLRRDCPTSSCQRESATKKSSIVRYSGVKVSPEPKLLRI